MDRRDHVVDIVGRVVATEVARVRARGVVVAAPDGDARALLSDWLAPFADVTLPADDEVAALAHALEPTGADGDVRTAVALRAWAASIGAARGLLPVGAPDKTTLLLGPLPLAARVLPLGDLSASALAELGYTVSLPPLLRGQDPEVIRRVDAALAAYLERGVAPEAAFAPLGALGKEVRRALDASGPRRRGVLVPKLTEWTAGIDPDR